jgi:ATP phosphoribosyltransferase
MSDTSTKIVVSKNATYYDASQRLVHIMSDLAGNTQQAVYRMLEIVQKMLSKVREPRKETEKTRYPSPNKNARVSTKLVLKSDQANYVIGGAKGYFAKGLRREFDVNIKVFQDRGVRCLRRDDYILVSYSKVFNS